MHTHPGSTAPAPWLALLLALALCGCAATPLFRETAAPSYVLPDTEGTALAAAARHWRQGAAPGDSTVSALVSGLDSLAARLLLAERAEQSLDLQYYIFRDDDSGAALLDALGRAAGRGVRVRLLLDDWGARPSDQRLRELAAHPGVEVRLFNPLPLRSKALSMLLDFDASQRRMHNKLFVADDRFAIVGGRNVGGEYFEHRGELEFGDLDLIAAGPVVRQCSEGFDAYWNSPFVRSLAPGDPDDGAPTDTPRALEALRQAVRDSGFADLFDRTDLLLRQGPAIVVQDYPDKVTGATLAAAHIGRRLSDLAGGIRSDLLIVSPYFVPGPGGVELLTGWHRDGARVRVVTNSLAATDVPAVHAGYARYRRELLENGIELYEFRPDARLPRRARGSGGSSRVSLHAKAIVVDRRATFVGSMNLDQRSLHLNTENGILVESPGLSAGLADGVAQVLEESAWKVELRDGRLAWVSHEGGREVVLTQEPGASAWQSIKTFFLSLLPVEDLL
jgi:putative cardiolipin synthase